VVGQVSDDRAAPSAPGVFVNYRHEDTQGTAWALVFQLEARFGPENVFFDNGTLRPGMQWFDEIKAHASSAGTLLSLIGPRWLPSLIAHMKPGGEPDYVAKEIELALRAQPRVSIIPVVIDDTDPPSERDLPLCLKALAGKHVEHLRHSHLREDIDRLIERLEELRIGAQPSTAKRGTAAREVQEAAR